MEGAVASEPQAEVQLQMLLGVAVLEFTVLADRCQNRKSLKTHTEREKNPEKCNMQCSSGCKSEEDKGMTAKLPR